MFENKSSRWLAPASLDEVEWLPADREVIEMLKSDTIFGNYIRLYTKGE